MCIVYHIMHQALKQVVTAALIYDNVTGTWL